MNILQQSFIWHFFFAQFKMSPESVCLKEGTGQGVRYLLCHAGDSIGELKQSVEDWMKTHDYTQKFDIHHGVAVARSIGAAAGLLTGNTWLDAQLDTIALNLYDIVQKVIAYYKETDKVKKVQMKNEIEKTILEDCFSGLESLVKLNGGQFSMRLTWLDIFFVGVVDVIEFYMGEGTITKKYPHLAKLIKNIKELPEIKQYLTKDAAIKNNK